MRPITTGASTALPLRCHEQKCDPLVGAAAVACCRCNRREPYVLAWARTTSSGYGHPLSIRFRDAAAVLTTPLLPDDYLGQLNPLWSTLEPRGRVEAVIAETRDCVTLWLRPGRG